MSMEGKDFHGGGVRRGPREWPDRGQIREGLKGKGNGPPEGHSNLGVFAGVVGNKSKNFRLNMALLR